MIERRKSRIEGWGVFATQPINKNKRIVTYDGDLDEAARLALPLGWICRAVNGHLPSNPGHTHTRLRMVLDGRGSGVRRRPGCRVGAPVGPADRRTLQHLVEGAASEPA